MAIMFIDFKKGFELGRGEPSPEQAQVEALEIMNRWRAENSSAKIVSIETLISDHGSSMTSAGGRKFIAFRLWYESP